GGDATSAQVQLPDTLKLVVGVNGLGSVELPACGFSAYGTSLELRRNQNAPFFDDSTRMVVIPVDSSAPGFQFAEIQSTLFEVRRSGTLFGAGWALPTVVTAPDKLGPATGAGFLWVGMDPGLLDKWPSLEESFVVAKTILVASPGMIFLTTTLQESVEQT